MTLKQLLDYRFELADMDMDELKKLGQSEVTRWYNEIMRVDNEISEMMNH